ncbi:hypothetical protein [Dokdonella koreensis]|uniref:Transmembrane protein n=1 Tax=Dokdonella koreensis DS-123 TaxID=1300342 RepID=A0A167G8H1_9GAMM|nr:hypothetical protein [Dokdonella koreensis]ANB16261.1 Hypothetical protein I596_222 [Dokdonella koreensis DS-123]
MKPEQIERWKVVRAKGRWRYVLVNGIASYGLAMFVVMTFFVNRDKLSPGFIAVSALLWTLGGAAFGAITWWWFERRYRAAGRRGTSDF